MDIMDHSAMSDGPFATEPTKKFNGGVTTMMQGMMAQPTGKPYLDFALGLIIHHQGAIVSDEGIDAAMKGMMSYTDDADTDFIL